ncbi:hypothetical protein HPB50_013425 [Hyalomma asiaticum]|uniref:Uncharacterized protein n=1 Tax=Hyalomma asiaticum TaxID=266040 RepID=A0ACB7RJQ7_HYAAI|nr:hypothetical protein HPB50_013425 [Hyalomma asiaticum]
MAKFPQRIYCANYLRRDKRKIKYKRNFRTVKDLGIDDLRKVLQADRDLEVHESHVLCQNSFRNLKECISNVEYESSHSSDSFHTTAEVLESINAAICTTSPLSPLKPPRAIKKAKRPSYVKRKVKEITAAAVRNIRSGIRIA